MKHVVVLGGGFAGVAACLELMGHTRDIKITLVDRNPYHTFTPSLYEVATSEEPQKNVAIPFKEIFGGKVHVIVDGVEKINTENSQVKLKKYGAITYDFLIITLGSESAYFGIKGLEEYALSLKTIDDAITIRNKIKVTCCKDGECHKKTKLIIGGGGFSGTELAAEMLMYKSRLARQEGLDGDCLEVAIIQGSDRLLKELDPHVSRIATKRIAGKSVSFCFGGHIKEVTKSWVATDDGKQYNYDILVWTGGVTPNHLIKNSDLPVSTRGQLLVNEYLQVAEHPNIFAAGDIAAFIDTRTQKPAPGVAQVAEEEGKVAGKNVGRLIKNASLLPYRYRHFGYVVPLKGRYAAAELEGFHMDGFFAWVLQQLVFFRYLLGILPWWKAFRRWHTFELELAQ